MYKYVLFALVALVSIGLFHGTVNILTNTTAQSQSIELPEDFLTLARIANPEQIILIEFTDFECPFCKEAQPQVAVLAQLQPELGIYKRHFLGHDNSLAYAIAYECDNSLSDSLFDGEIPSTPCIENELTKETVFYDEQLIRELNIRGTPTFLLVNTQNTQQNQLYEGLPDIQSMQQIIDAWQRI